MVVHPAPGNPTGTLVNAFLHHCGLPPVPVEPQAVADDSLGISRDISSSSLHDCVHEPLIPAVLIC